ncbi:hypothetical protein C5167_049033 [Papaver somniferum]|uniref:Uncharacterized protein n=1 Tax=Papaver somniferum TaxID=3469 RepID=A0A4Y7KJM4_PAPSO|nr:hypothetical protein C5167_049033 [Papaver somniferum]
MRPSELWNPDTEEFITIESFNHPIEMNRTNLRSKLNHASEKDKKIEELFNELQHEKQRSAGFQERHCLVLNDIRQAKQLAVLHSQ